MAGIGLLAVAAVCVAARAEEKPPLSFQPTTVPAVLAIYDENQKLLFAIHVDPPRLEVAKDMATDATAKAVLRAMQEYLGLCEAAKKVTK